MTNCVYVNDVELKVGDRVHITIYGGIDRGYAVVKIFGDRYESIAVYLDAEKRSKYYFRNECGRWQVSNYRDFRHYASIESLEVVK